MPVIQMSKAEIAEFWKNHLNTLACLAKLKTGLERSEILLLERGLVGPRDLLEVLNEAIQRQVESFASWYFERAIKIIDNGHIAALIGFSTQFKDILTRTTRVTTNRGLDDVLEDIFKHLKKTYEAYPRGSNRRANLRDDLKGNKHWIDCLSSGYPKARLEMCDFFELAAV